MKRPKKWVRLACDLCDRDDCDGITESQLEKLRLTWKDINEEQSWADSMTVWTEEQMQLDWDRSNFEWWTHMGRCPRCIAEDEESDRLEKQAALF